MYLLQSQNILLYLEHLLVLGESDRAVMKQIIEGTTGNWEVVIGLEVHAQIASKSKLFSGSSTQFGAQPNTQVSLVDAAMPGMLPVLNKECVKKAILTGLALDARINLLSAFDRKNYFYADLPQGYQISQFTHPIVGNGILNVDMPSGEELKVRITRIHLEQDAGKSLHDQSDTESLIDLNRSGIGLMEIVTEADIRSGEGAAECIKKLRSIMRYIGTCDGDMERGSLRCDANVSVRKIGEKKLGTRAEIKNLNSTRNIIKAIEYEAQRQVEILESGGKIEQETRLFNAEKLTTRSMRAKEESSDYRYFPDPDLPPLHISQEYIDQIRETLPELPDQKRSRYIADYSLSKYDASILTSEKSVADYFDDVLKHTVSPKMAANWIAAELFGKLNKESIQIEDSPIKPNQLASLIQSIESDVISGKIAKEVFEIMFTTGKDPSQIIEEKGLKQITDESTILSFVENVMSSNHDKVEQYKSGKDKLFGFFVGQVMKLSQGKANPGIVNKLIKQQLNQ